MPLEDLTPYEEYDRPNDQPDPAVLASRRTFVKVAIAGVVGLGLAGAGTVLYLEDRADRQRRLRESFRDPHFTEPFDVESKECYPYSDSLLRIHGQIEEEILGVHPGTQETLAIADNIANRVASQSVGAAKRLGFTGNNPQAALGFLASTEDGLRAYCGLIAQQLHEAGCIVKSCNTLREAVDSANKLHQNGHFHLDCDFLTNVALHAAKRHDMPLHSVHAPIHEYVGSPAFPDFAAELTAVQFLGKDAEKYAEYVHLTHAQQRERFTFKDPSSIERFGYFQPTPELLARATMYSSVCGVQMEKAQKEYDVQTMEEQVARYAAMKEIPGKKKKVTECLYYAHVRSREEYIERYRKSKSAADLTKALTHAGRSLALVREHQAGFEQWFIDDERRLEELQSNRTIRHRDILQEHVLIRRVAMPKSGELSIFAN